MNINQLELNILKVLITNKQLALDFVNDCDVKLFSSDVWNFAHTVFNYIKLYRDIPTLRILIEKNAPANSQKAETLTKTWNLLQSITYDELEYKHDLEKLKKKFFDRQIIAIKDLFSKMDPASIDVAKSMNEMNRAIHNINSLSESKAYERKTLKEALPAFVEKFNARKNNPELDTGLKTKYSYIDYATNGIKPADFIVIAGESGFGKSLFLNNIAVQTWMQDNTIDTDISKFTEGKNIIYFSLEMPYEDCFVRLISKLSGVNSRKIERSSLDKDEFAKVKKALDFIKNYPYHFEIVDIADASSNDLEAILNEAKYKVDAIFVDYLGIMKTNESKEDQDWLKQGIISYELRAIGRKYNLPIFSAVQLNRRGSGKDPAESIGLHRLARSATIATHCTLILQLESNGVNDHLYPQIDIFIIKNRKGPKGKFSLLKDLSRCTLVDIPITVDAFDNFQNTVDDISQDLELLNI